MPDPSPAPFRPKRRVSKVVIEIVVRQLLGTRHKFKLRVDGTDTSPIYSVYLDNEPAARFFGPDWTSVLDQILRHEMKYLSATDPSFNL